MDIQNIGADIGRGYVKGFTEVDGVEKSCLFKSIVGIGWDMDFENYDNPLFLDIKFDKEDYNNCFFGYLAERECNTPIVNSKDSKTTTVAIKLLSALLYELAEGPEVNLVLGVPNRGFNKSNLAEVIDTYKDKTINIVNNINGESKKIHINDITIFRESDAALMYQVTKHKLNNSNDNVMVSVGFRTTEISYFDNKLKFLDNKSKSLEIGNQDVLKTIQKSYPTRSLAEIDSSNRYNDMKKEGYRNLSDLIDQQLDSELVNLNEINLYLAGGVSNYLNVKNAIITEDPQLITAKGLYLIANKYFK